MTVLTRYERLECAGVWRESADGQRRNVFIVLGDATLMIKDAADAALSHWSLPAVERINPGRAPALYRPGPGSEETLEITDTTMIDAIGTIRRAIGRSHASRGRLRRGSGALIFALLLVLAVFWLPDALARHTVKVLPGASQRAIGERLLTALEPVAGLPCATPDGRRALEALTGRLFGDAPVRIVVLPGGPERTASLPGELLLVQSGLIADAPEPRMLAAALLAERQRAVSHPPLSTLMHTAGPGASLRLLSRGEIAQSRIDSFAGTLLTHAPVPADHAAVEARLGTLSADGPLLDEASWQRLRGICGD